MYAVIMAGGKGTRSGEEPGKETEAPVGYRRFKDHYPGNYRSDQSPDPARKYPDRYRAEPCCGADQANFPDIRKTISLLNRSGGTPPPVSVWHACTY